LSIPYSEQAPMGAHSSSAKIWGWAVTRRKCFKWFNYPRASVHPDAKLAAMAPNRLASSVRPCFVEASPTVEKAVSWFRADWLVASLLSKFPQRQSSPVVREFHAANEERCEPGHGQVCANLMSWCPKRIRAMWAQRTFHYARISMVGGYTENPEKPQNCQKWGVGACSGQYGIYYCFW